MIRCYLNSFKWTNGILVRGLNDKKILYSKTYTSSESVIVAITGETEVETEAYTIDERSSTLNNGYLNSIFDGNGKEIVLLKS